MAASNHADILLGTSNPRAILEISSVHWRQFFDIGAEQASKRRQFANEELVKALKISGNVG